MNLLGTLLLISSVVSLVLAFTVLRFNSRNVVNRLVALTSFTYTVWAFGAAVGVPAQGGEISPDPAWIPFRLALAGNILSQVCALGIAIAYAKIRGWKAWALVVPFVVAALVQTYQALTAVWVIRGFHIGPTGGQMDLNANSIWPSFDAWYTNLSWLLSLVILIGAYRKNPSRRYRSILLQVIWVGVFIRLAAFLCVLAWLILGWPDVSVLVGFLGILNYYVMIVRYQHLMDDKPQLTGVLFSSLPEAILLADNQGKLVEVSATMARLWGKTEEELRGKKVFTLFDGWPKLASHWQTVTRDHIPQTNLVGRLADELFLVDLTPGKNGFGDLQGVSIQLKPVAALGGTAKYGISERECEVARLMGQGLENQAIAQGLSISSATVKNHAAKLFSKTGAKNRVELVRLLQSPEVPC